MAIPVVGKVMKKVFGSQNERMVKRYLGIADQVGEFDAAMRRLSDAELRAKTDEFRERIANGEKSTDMIPEVFAVAREAMDRSVGIRNIFDPELKFDPSRLPDAARKLYDETQAKIAEIEDAAPEGLYQGCEAPVPGWRQVEIPQDLYEAVRGLYPESKPPFRARPFDVQIIGAMVLYEGRIAEMKTGEGKTIVAPLATYLAALEGQKVYVVTVNEYLVQRDRDWTFPFFASLGLTVGAIHPQHMQSPPQKTAAYECDVVYGTTSEFGFDYLRDNMKLAPQEQFQKRREFAIVDEVDSVLIDEARTPLIISGMAHSEQPRYELADRLARHLMEIQKEWNGADQKVQSCLVDISGLEGDIRNARDKDKVPALKKTLEEKRAALARLESARDQYTQFYEVELDKKRATLTHEGIEAAQREAGLGSFYVGENVDIPHLLENAIRAHAVYQRDRDYVVAPDEEGQMSVVIVDQNTGRKMIGRQWSDGLHQAVEAKEGVPIKQETQTMATITIQNYFKQFDKLAGMTGTADTEATEFYEIYQLDVVVIPTNVPVIRNDHNDLVFISEKDKWEAIVDEIKAFHDVGRPVLVGTTSVENSEKLSDMLTKKHRIKHEVLNAKQHEREADIILEAGRLGAVMIATNMAGRGTDIKLGPVSREDLLNHWKLRGVCPKNIQPDSPDDVIIAACYRHLAEGLVKKGELPLGREALADMSGDQIELELLRHWARETTMLSEGKINGLDADRLRDELDAVGACLWHRLQLWSNVEALGGLHVIGTERHESRRIDNQLRGRAGRQGDRGSSRFFLSLEDDLMKMFAGPTMLKVLSRLGMKEGDAIEHPMLTRSVEKAQRKVEERNFLWRKNILEYDEVMDIQRHEFYGRRQQILEGREVKKVVLDELDTSIEDAALTYLDPMHAPNCIAEWVREHMNVGIDADRIKGKDREDLHRLVRIDAKEEAANVIRITLGEYAPDDVDPADWDYQALVNWANANFHADLKIADVHGKSAEEIARMIEVKADVMIDQVDLAPLDQYLVPDYGAPRELARWAKTKFEGEFDPSELAKADSPLDAAEMLMNAARDQYREREVTYPVDFAIDLTTANMNVSPQQAITQFCEWARARYEIEWIPSALPSGNPLELREILLEEARKIDDETIARRVEKMTDGVATPDELNEKVERTLRARLTDEERERAETDIAAAAEEAIRRVLRSELAQFERWILLQIYDQSWKDHLLAMDQIKQSIGFRSISQRDPRIEFKREGAAHFVEMKENIRDKITDIIFRGKLSPQMQRPQQPTPEMIAAARQRAAQQGEGQGAEGGGATPAPARPTPPTPAQPSITAAAAAAASAGTPAQREQIAAAERAGGEKTAEARKPQPRRSGLTIGRNEVVTIMNPATGEKESMKYKKAQPLIAEGWRLVAE